MVGGGHRLVGAPLGVAQAEAGVPPGVWVGLGLPALGCLRVRWWATVLGRPPGEIHRPLLALDLVFRPPSPGAATAATAPPSSAV